MTRRLFGTDGMRAVFGTPPLDRSTVQAVGYWFARLCGGRRPAPLLILGGDTRSSRTEIAGWLAAAIRAAGCEVRSAGVVPTPAVAYLVTELGAAGGIVVSASHNPYTDNGVKLIGADGFKVDPSVEQAIEDRLEDWVRGSSDPLPPQAADRIAAGEAGDQPDDEPELADRYLDHLAASLPPDRPLAGLRIAVDAANGAGAPYAERLFTGLGADCAVTCDQPDGRNINLDCGSTCTERVAAFTRATGSDLGVALDGDADRALLCDHRGRICDGDILLYVWATYLAARDDLPGRRIVATTMSNMGLEKALEAGNVDVVRCGVGDREVVDVMRRQDIRLGGEQSGHLVDLELGTTGDGLLTAAAVAAIVAASGRSLAYLAAGFRRFPQTLRNVKVREKQPLESVPGLSEAVASVERELGTSGRVLLRYSGTEALARVMIEGPDQARIEELCSSITSVLEAELGA
ncbi:MAG: phosphoglucosamine mutase [Holophagales bacterium]|nr:phosphoglucosamine mutase [Holophagales bacterium]MYG32205.1 phosphoglucosamine mutase [Holophagales bacterium]MYI80186.1 phosphoglucosamine mutase [Holophagales bacterium]